MIELTYSDYASYNDWNDEKSQWGDEECKNNIYLLENSLFVRSVSRSFEADMVIAFDVNKNFIQELKALIMVMENTFVEEGEQ